MIGCFSSRPLAKALRLYGMHGWLSQRYERHMDEYAKAEMKVMSRRAATQMAGGAMVLVRDGEAYAFLIYLMLQGNLPLGDFVLMFAAIGSFAELVMNLIDSTGKLQRGSSDLTVLRKLWDYPDASKAGPGAPLPPKGKTPEIRLEGVGYRYSGAEKPALSGVSITIKLGERIAVVGANGAGKTTLVKLICGLYRPTEGRIRIDGTDIGEFNRDGYFTLISAVFQDIHLLASSIAANVSQQELDKTDMERGSNALGWQD
jgi:ATP-binding cassette subfamily B protein